MLAGMEWILLALVAAVSMALQVEANRRFNCDGLQLNYWRGLVATVLLLPVVVLVEWPHGPWVYAVAFINGAGSVATCTLLFNLAAKKQSRVSSLYAPMSTFVGLLFWLTISAVEQQRIVTHPIAGLMLVMALAAAAYGLHRLRTNDASWSALLAIIPVGLFYGFIDVFTRLSLDGQALPAAALVYSFGCFISMTVLNYGVLKLRGVALRPQGVMLKAAGILGVASVVFLLALSMAIMNAPHPTYPSFFLMTMPVMLLAWHHLTGTKDDADWRAALLIVAGAVLASVQGIVFN